MLFSQRFGHKKVRDLIQVESVDEELRNALWSLLKIHVWDHTEMHSGMYDGYYLSSHSNAPIRALCERLWFSYFKKPLDTLGNDWSKILPRLRSHFFECEWYEVYDFVEFVANNYERYQFKDSFIDQCNFVMTREMAGYRFVGSQISPITDKQEVAEIDSALDSASTPVRAHLKRALELLSDRSTPDYRNSIKESISAVESCVAKTVGADKGTLGQLIKKLEDQVGLHPALKTAFSNLYGYTSDEGGIRHALLEQKEIKFEDAKFFLIVCSAFINFVAVKIKAK